MRKLVAVIRREFVERVRSRAFVISTILGPVLMGVMIGLPLYLTGRETMVRRIVVLDGASGTFGERTQKALNEARVGSGGGARERYAVQVLRVAGRIQAVRDSLIRTMGLPKGPASGPDGLLILTDEALGSGTLTYLGSNVSSLTDMETLEATLQGAVLAERLSRAKVDSVVLQNVAAPIRLEKAKVTNGRVSAEGAESSFFLSYTVSLVLYFALVVYGVQVMSSTLEEKTNRIVEVLSSSLTPSQLMFGKVIGVGAVGLFQLTIWAAAALYLTMNLPAILGSIHVASEVPTAASLPAVGTDLVLVSLVFFLLGFFLYAGLYAAIGAMCSSHQDTQQANAPVTMLIVVSFIVSLFPILNEPQGTLARVLTFVPFAAPFAVPLRYSIAPLSAPDLLFSVLCTVFGAMGSIWVAARIYRVGILSYGKRPTFREVARWIARG